MSKPPTMSGRARRYLHRKSLVVGPILLAVFALWGVIGWAATADAETAEGRLVGALTGMFLFGGLFGLIGVILTGAGVLGELKARRINREDWALAQSIADRCEALLRQPSHTAYSSAAVQEVAPQHLLEVERHFDQRTAGDVRGTVMHQFSLFGATLGVGRTVGSRSVVSGGAISGALKGLSDVHLTLASTTRSDLMGDAIFALFETSGPDGSPDTLRVTALSNGAVLDWVRALVGQTAQAFGMDTHTGVTISNYAARLAAHFGPADVSYLSDRLHLVAAQTKRGEEPAPVTLRGVPAGRGAMVATTARVGGNGQPDLQVFPTAFPVLWGETVGEAIDAAGSPKTLAA